jgi:hypothetical protein
MSNLAHQLAAYCTANPNETSLVVTVAIRHLIAESSPEKLRNLATLLPTDHPPAISLASSLRLLAEDRQTAPFSLGDK